MTETVRVQEVAERETHPLPTVSFLNLPAGMKTPLTLSTAQE